MRIDASRLAPAAELQADVAVVGAGPAGIVLALELAGAGHSVCLIESGSNSFNAAAQRLVDTVGADPAHVPMSLTTRRQVGGTSNLWAGRCVPFDRVDFQRRKLTGYADWPVGYDELVGYFPRACEWLVCGAAVFDARELPELAGRSLIPGWPDGNVRATALERWSLPTNFGRRYRAQLEASQLVTLVTGLTCTEILSAPDGSSVDRLSCRTLAGASVTVRATRHVLACGGLEATRLLFASRRLHPQGIGNHAGHLGHWYMAHVECCIARVHFSTPPSETIHGYERDRAGIYVRRRFTFSPEFTLEHDLPNLAMWIDNPELGDPSHRSGTLSLLYLLLISPLGKHLIAEAIRQSQTTTTRPASKWAHVANIARSLGPTAKFAIGFGYRRFIGRGHKAPGVFAPSASNVYPLNYHGEHLPHYSSQVAPASECDALGVPRLRTQLRFADADVRSVTRAHEHFDRYLKHHGLGFLEYLYENPAQAIREQLYGGYHQAGTTRMAADPEDGVLDAELAVHGFSDLFVASSSAFVTSSQANTTLMIVAFALRLADRLRRDLAC
ncbi:MAG TPA: GMC family oxidoreductase [Solirubrobacteraceae bacterium]|nr:GMC family oxidoreductase [Solirubrobacteraceae bacterium]